MEATSHCDFFLFSKQVAREPAEKNSVFAVGSAASFSRPTNINLNNKFIVFDVSEMTNEMLPIGQYITLDFVLDAAKTDKTKNKVIAMDEM